MAFRKTTLTLGGGADGAAVATEQTARFGRWCVADLAEWLILAAGARPPLAGFSRGASVEIFSKRRRSQGSAGATVKHGLAALVAGIVLCILGGTFLLDRETSIAEGMIVFFSAGVLLAVPILTVVFVVDFRSLSRLGRQVGFEPTVGWRGIGLYSLVATAAVALAGAVTLVVTWLRHKSVESDRSEAPQPGG
jgi:hypothetical protein